MKTYISDIIPRISRFSKRIDITTFLTNKNWVLLTNEINLRIEYIFSENDNVLRIAENGRIIRGKWEYLGNNSLEIDIGGNIILFKYAFHEEKSNILALRRSGTDEYAILVEEPQYETFLNTIERFNAYIETKYLNSEDNTKPFKPQEHDNLSINSDQKFIIKNFPDLEIQMEELKSKLSHLINKTSANIIISYAKDHVIKRDWLTHNSELVNHIVSNKNCMRKLENIFEACCQNPAFENELIKYIYSKFYSM